MASTLGAYAVRFSNFARDARTPGRVRLLLRRLEPWYDWGTYGILRVDGEGEGEGKFFAVDFLGLHITFVVGLTPAKNPAKSGESA